MSRKHVHIALKAALLPGALALVVLALVGGSSKVGTAKSCPRGYESLAAAQAREQRDGGREQGEGGDADSTLSPVIARSVCRPAVEIDGPAEVASLQTVRTRRITGGYPVKPGAFASAAREGARLAKTSKALRVPGSGGRWIPMGSGPLLTNDATYDVSKEGIPTSNGRINSWAYDSEQNRLYAGISYGGVWESDDVGRTWRSIGDSLPTQIVGSVAYSPSHGGTVIVLTGDQNNGQDSFTGYGAFRTTNDGRSWHKARGVPDGTLGYKITVDPTRPDVVYAATGFGLYRSTDDGATFTNVDLPTGSCHGETYSRKDCYLANVVSDVVVEAPDSFGHKGGNVLAAVGWRAGATAYTDGTPQAPGNGLYASASGAPGSFKKLDATGFTPQNRIGRVELGGAIGPKQNHDYLYAEVQDAQLLYGGVPVIDLPEDVKAQNIYRPTSFNGVYVSSDFGKTWTEMMSTADVANPTSESALVPVGAVPVVGSYLPGIQAWYNEWIAPDPTLQASGGIPTRLSFGLEEVWQNVGTGQPLTGRTSFHVIGRYYAGEVCQLGLVPTVPGLVPCPTSPEPTNSTTHPDQHDGIWIPDGHGGVTLVAGNDGGAWTQHAGPGAQMSNQGWGQGANEEMHTLLPYDAAMAKDGTIVAGLQDNGEMKITPSGRQSEIFGGDAFYTAINPDDPNVIYEEYAYGVMKVTKDGGRSWRSMSTSDEVNGNGAQFSAPLVMDPLDPNHIVAGGARVMETTAGPETSSADQADIATTPATTAGYDPSRPQWQNVFDLGTGSDGNANSITAIDTRGDATYVGFCGQCDLINGGSFASGIATNVGGGAAPKKGTSNGWHRAAARGLPARLVNWVAIDPTDPRTVYVALGGYKRRWLAPGAVGDSVAKVGAGHVFKSTDAGATFRDVSGDLPDGPVEALLVHSDQLVAATDVGVFTSPTKDGGRWASLGTGLPNAPVVSMRTEPGDPDAFVAAVYGRGVYTYRFAPPACQDTKRPTSRIGRLTARAAAAAHLVIRGKSKDRGCDAKGRGKVRRVTVAIVRKVGKRCRYASLRGRLGRPTSCRKRRYLRARGTSTWRLTLRGRLPAGRYTAYVRARDRAGNVEKLGKRDRLRFTIRRR